jgi:hypothetical protein
MYFIMMCQSPMKGDLAMLGYQPDDPFRSWASGDRFSTDPAAESYDRPPPEPVHAEILKGYSGIMAEFWDDPVPLMTKRLHKALLAAGVDNLDVYQAEIVDPKTKAVNQDYVAFNIVGKISAADLKKSQVDPGNRSKMVSMDLNSVAIDEGKARGALLFRLAESVNAIVVHEKVKQAILAQGINTLTFIPPEQWAG